MSQGQCVLGQSVVVRKTVNPKWADFEVAFDTKDIDKSLCGESLF